MSRWSRADKALAEWQLESASLYDDRERIGAEAEITASAIAARGRPVSRFLNLACGPSDHHLRHHFARHPGAALLALDVSPAFAASARRALAAIIAVTAATEGRPGSGPAAVATADMRTLPLADGSFDLVGLYGNSFGFFDDATNLHVLGEIHRVLAPGGTAVVTVPSFAHAASFTEAAPQTWTEGAQTVCGRLEARGRRHYDPATGYSLGLYDLWLADSGERLHRSEARSRVYPFESTVPGLPSLSGMAAEVGFGDAALVAIPPERTRHAKGLMERMDCLLLSR